MNTTNIIHERNEALNAIKTRILKSQVNKAFLSKSAIVSIVLEQPAPRFYVTPRQAELLIWSYNRRGQTFPPNMRRQKREMVLDLLQNYERLRVEHPYASKWKIYEMLVMQPAKSFYMTPTRVRDVIFSYSGRI